MFARPEDGVLVAGPAPLGQDGRRRDPERSRGLRPGDRRLHQGRCPGLRPGRPGPGSVRCCSTTRAARCPVRQECERVGWSPLRSRGDLGRGGPRRRVHGASRPPGTDRGEASHWSERAGGTARSACSTQERSSNGRSPTCLPPSTGTIPTRRGPRSPVTAPNGRSISWRASSPPKGASRAGYGPRPRACSPATGPMPPSPRRKAGSSKQPSSWSSRATLYVCAGSDHQRPCRSTRGRAAPRGASRRLSDAR